MALRESKKNKYDSFLRVQHCEHGTREVPNILQRNRCLFSSFLPSPPSLQTIVRHGSSLTSFQLPFNLHVHKRNGARECYNAIEHCHTKRLGKERRMEGRGKRGSKEVLAKVPKEKDSAINPDSLETYFSLRRYFDKTRAQHPLAGILKMSPLIHLRKHMQSNRKVNDMHPNASRHSIITYPFIKIFQYKLLMSKLSRMFFRKSNEIS